ncbi:MAG: hypothetical protein AAB368_10655, partial [bacterium]
ERRHIEERYDTIFESREHPQLDELPFFRLRLVMITTEPQSHRHRHRTHPSVRPSTGEIATRRPNLRPDSASFRGIFEPPRWNNSAQPETSQERGDMSEIKQIATPPTTATLTVDCEKCGHENTRQIALWSGFALFPPVTLPETETKQLPLAVVTEE